MRINRNQILAFLIWIGNLHGSDVPFISGERLEYSLKWGFIPVGSAVMEVLPTRKKQGENLQVIRFSVRTNDFADAFYKVRTVVESEVSEDFSKSYFYSKTQREGKTKRDVKVRFDYQRRVAEYVENNGESRTVEIQDPVFDPLAIAYFFRLNPIGENSQRVLPTCDGKRFMQIVVRTGPYDRMTVPAGKFKVVGTTPEMKNLSGVFKKSPDGILRVWYSADNRRLPVKISSKVVVGSFTASLVKTSGLVSGGG